MQDGHLVLRPELNVRGAAGVGSVCVGGGGGGG